MSEKDMLENIVVAVSVEGKTLEGTGFFISKDMIITCYHVLDANESGLKEFYWIKHDSWKKWEKAKPIHEKCDMIKDIAVLHSEIFYPMPAYLPLKIWDTFSTSFISFGYGSDTAKTSQQLKSYHIDGEIKGHIRLDAGPPLRLLQLETPLGTIYPGRSGSPIVSKDQNAIIGAMNFYGGEKNKTSEILTAIPIEDILPNIISLGKLFNVPNLPANFLHRTEDLSSFKKVVLSESNKARPMIGVHGMGGIGKSVLAAATANDDGVRSHFQDGVFWLTLGTDPKITVKKVREDESRIFGSAGNDIGQSRVHLRLKLPENTGQYKDPVLKYADGESVGPGARYLGYGVVEAFPNRKKNTKEGQVLRSCLKYPFDGMLSILIKNGTIEDDVKSVANALIAMGLFGGLGSRSRKGYGSFNIEELKFGNEIIYKRPEDVEELKKQIESLFSSYGIKAYPSLPPYTAYSNCTRIDIVDKGPDPLRLLNSIGEAMQMYRSWGRNGKVNSKDSEMNFKDDHDLAAQSIKTKVGTHPRRAVFGLPHNYYFSSYQEKVDVKPARLERRASPLFIHIHELINGHYAAIMTILPAEFLPEGERIKVNKSIVPQHVDFKVLHEFVDGKDGSGKPRFPYAVPVINSKTSTKCGAIQ